MMLTTRTIHYVVVFLFFTLCFLSYSSYSLAQVSIEKSDQNHLLKQEFQRDDLTVQPRNNRVDVTLYGQINRALVYVDDGFQDTWRHVDSDASYDRKWCLRENCKNK